MNECKVRSYPSQCLAIGRKAWMHDNFLKLNETKTELLFVGTPTALHKFNSSNLITDNDFVTSVILI